MTIIMVVGCVTPIGDGCVCVVWWCVCVCYQTPMVSKIVHRLVIIHVPTHARYIYSDADSIPGPILD